MNLSENRLPIRKNKPDHHSNRQRELHLPRRAEAQLFAGRGSFQIKFADKQGEANEISRPLIEAGSGVRLRTITVSYFCMGAALSTDKPGV
jgi:hypothetical protein